jgi:fatty-acid desaturase
MPIIEARRTQLSLPFTPEKFHTSPAKDGAIYTGTIGRYRAIEITDPDHITVHYPGQSYALEGEEVNRYSAIIPASHSVRWVAPPFPVFRDEQINLLWAPVETDIQSREGLLRTDDAVLAEPTDDFLELARDLSSISRSQDDAAYTAWFQHVAEQIDRRVPQGAPMKAFVEGISLAGLGLTLKGRDRAPITAAMQGLLALAGASTIGSVVNHRMASHGSVEFSPNTLKVLRVVNALEVGYVPDNFRAMHDVHHKYVDTPDDPHSPAFQGRWKVFFGISRISHEFSSANSDRVAELQDDPRTKRSPLDSPLVVGLGIAGTHWLMAKALRQPSKYWAVSAAIHGLGLNMINGTFTGDAHPNGAAEDFEFGPIMSIIMGGETDHARHHEEPWNPKHASVDPGYALIILLKKLGLATIPAETLMKKPNE